jgi:hypothetical protein
VASIQAIVETYGRRYELIPEIEHHDADEALVTAQQARSAATDDTQG